LKTGLLLNSRALTTNSLRYGFVQEVENMVGPLLSEGAQHVINLVIKLL